MSRIAKIAIAAAAVLAALLGALGWYAFSGRSTGDQFAQCRATNVAGGSGALGGPFELVNQHGEAVSDAQVIDKPSLLYFGYTFCPDVCPIDVDRNAVAIDVLQERGYDAQPVFISVDPARDTPEALEAFASNMHPDMVGLTGTDAQVRAAAQAYRVYYDAHDDTEDPYYLVDHSTFSYFVLPGHGFVEFFRRDEPPEALADRMSCFIDAAGDV